MHCYISANKIIAFGNNFDMKINMRSKIFVLSVALLVSLIIVMPNYNCSFVSYVRKDSDVSFYLLSKTEHLPRFCNQIDIGSGAIVRCKGSVANDVAKSLDSITGVSFTFKGGDKEVDDFLKRVDAVVLNCETVGNISSCFAYSRKLKNGIRVDGELVNIQVARNGNTITIGSPIILGEY